MPESGEIPLSVLKSQHLKAKPGMEAAFAESDAMAPIASAMKSQAIEFANTHGAEPWLLDTLKNQDALDGIIAYMSSVDGGQMHILQEVKKIKPDLQWFRGGTSMKFRDSVGPVGHQNFTEEELNTNIIDGGENGILGKPNTALNFLRHTKRENPALYTLTIDDLISGLENNAINLSTEHFYDLTVQRGTDRSAYLKFCRDNLKIQPVKLDQ